MRNVRIVSVLFLLLFPVKLLYAQTYTHTVDSFLNLIDQTSGPELLKIYPRLHKALYEVNDINLHLKYNNDFAEAARTAKNKKAEAIAYVLNLEAMYNYRVPDSLLLAESLKAVDFMQDIPDAQVHYFFAAATVSDVYMSQGNYEKALSEAERFYKQAAKTNSSSGLVTSLQIMGKAYAELGVMDKSESAFRESIAVADERIDHGLKGESYSFLVDMLNGQNRYEDALEANKEFEAYLKRIEACNGELKNLCFLNDLGYVATYTKLGKYTLAHVYLSKAENYPVAATDMGSYSVENERFNLLTEEGRYREAELSLSTLEKILDGDASSYKALLKLQENRANLYYLWGKYDESASAYRNFIAENDSLQRVEIATRLNALRTEYEVDKLQMQKEDQKILFRNIVFWFFLVLILLCIIIAVTLINARIIKVKNQFLLNRIWEQDEMEQKYEQVCNELAKVKRLNTVEPTDYDQGENRDELYFRLKELMKDPAVFTDPNINRKVLADKLGTNEKYIFSVIKKYYATNISDYINNLRLNYARNLLALPNDKRTIDAIANDAGFNSRSNFYRLFKEQYGMTPVEFRQLIKHN